MNKFRSIIDRLKNAGRKESAMPDPTTATPAAAGLSKDDVQKMISDAVTASQTEITKQLGSLTELVTKAQTAPAAKADADKSAKAEPITAEAVAKIVAEQLAAASQSNAQKAQREAFQAEKLKDLPPAYRNQLGNDPSKWAAEEQTIREQFKADLKSVGAEPKSLGGAANEGGTTPEKAPVDKTKVDPVNRIEMGLK